MSKTTSRASSARRNAEALLGKVQKREATLKLEQEREHEAMVRKTARLRELRLAKEAEEEKLRPAATPSKPRQPKPRRSKHS
jgi:hypothetical protein